MYKSLFFSSIFHTAIIVLSIFTLPFIAKQPLDIPPLVSVELIQISDKTNIPFAPKAKKIIEKVKKDKEKLVSEQAPPKKIKKNEKKEISPEKNKENITELTSKKTPTPETKKEIVKKEKLDAIPLPDKNNEKLSVEEEKKQKPSKDLTEDENLKEIIKPKKPKIDDTKVKQASEFEKKELFDPNNIAALIDKSKTETSETSKKTDKITQDQQKSIESIGLSLSEEDALKAQIFGCWSIPLGLPYNENLLVRIKLQLNPDGTISQSEILDHARMNKPGQGFYKVLAESALRAIKLCQPLRVPTTGYERWKELQLNFDASEMLKG